MRKCEFIFGLIPVIKWGGPVTICRLYLKSIDPSIQKLMNTEHNYT